MEQLELLANEAFPPEENLTPAQLIEMTDHDDGLDIRALYADGKLIGYMVVKTHDTMAYLFFLAIDRQCRGTGHGSRAIKKLMELYPDHDHVVDFEMLDDHAPDHLQRVKRKQFYLRNGYRSTGHFVSYLGVTYEVACRGDSFDAALFKETLSIFAGDRFDPVHFEKN